MWTEWADILSQPWAVRALMASVMVGVSCGLLGCFIVLRNMALIGDALSHAVLPGIVIAFVLVGYSTLGFFVGSVLAGLVSAVAITWIQQHIKTKNDAAIGIVFTAMFALGVMGISRLSRQQGVHLDLKDFLFGNVLGVSDQDLYLTLGIAMYVMISIAVLYRHLFLSTFQPVIAQTMGVPVGLIHYFLMLLLSFAVVASLRTVGVILVVAMLITPASTALLLSYRLKHVLVISAIIGALAAVAGLLLAIAVETTPGPAMAIMATLFYVIAALFAPQKGLISRQWRAWNMRSKIKREDLLKHMYKNDGKSVPALQQEFRPSGVLSFGGVEQLLADLQKLGLVFREGNFIRLTESGWTEASRLVRAHRLWETYLVDKVGLTDTQIHADAEKFEHLLTDEILDEVDRQLGHPKVDPHGSVIPAVAGAPGRKLTSLPVGSIAELALQQSGPLIVQELWQLGLMPGYTIEVGQLDESSITILAGEKAIKLPLALANRITIQTE